MHQKLVQKCLALVNRKWLHDNTKPQNKLNNSGYKTLPHPPYSPDLLPTDYHFSKHPVNF